MHIFNENDNTITQLLFQEVSWPESGVRAYNSFIIVAWPNGQIVARFQGHFLVS